MRPSSSKPTRTSWSWPRSWAADVKCSRRSSVHLISRFSSRAAHGTRISSGHGWTIFTPKPPPTSGAITSTLPFGSPSRAAIAARTLVDACVDEYTRSDPSSASHRAYTPRPSSGMDALRSIARLNSSVWGAASIAAAASPFSWTRTAPTLPGTSSWTRCSARVAASMPTTAGSGSYSTRMRSAASSARYRSRATTIATGSPTCRTTSRASGYAVRPWVRAGCGISSGSGSPTRSGRSSHV